MEAMKAALEKAGVEFTNGKKPGLRLSKKRPQEARTPCALIRFS